MEDFLDQGFLLHSLEQNDKALITQDVKLTWHSLLSVLPPSWAAAFSRRWWCEAPSQAISH